MSTPTLLRMTAPLREDFDIPYHDFGPPSEAPAVALVAGLHGNELNGIFVLARLAGYLRRIEAGERPAQRLAGRVIVVPAVNVLGVNTRSRRWPFDGTDINRMFPGYDAGETTQRVAHAVLEVTRPALRRIDVHSSNLDFEELPQVRLYDPSEAERASARLFGLPAVIERPTPSVFTSTIGHAWHGCGGENFVIQAGFAGGLQQEHCEEVFRALVAFLSRTGVIAGISLADEDEVVHHFDLHQTFPVFSDHAGIFVPRCSVGTWIIAGAVIGDVYDAFDGEPCAELRAPMGGLLSGIRRQPLLFQGDLVARIQTRGQSDAGPTQDEQ